MTKPIMLPCGGPDVTVATTKNGEIVEEYVLRVSDAGSLEFYTTRALREEAATEERSKARKAKDAKEAEERTAALKAMLAKANEET